MNNLFQNQSGLAMHRRYDLKGSTQARCRPPLRYSGFLPCGVLGKYLWLRCRTHFCPSVLTVLARRKAESVPGLRHSESYAPHVA